ncbi:conserved hypothetical protein [Candidatus Phytoplasma mali]|uniref:Uncharacterized protein n=1 Tax=Phytoplasma mali (strain AT) TaxID=482235 RepID=B3R0N6_PHYMT|nr:hypothetical protein [Candidatus Phytoplasma mali]CAP18620.1 conserved hypothetical protein [Candidatus Phytoplasma mali]
MQRKQIIKDIIAFLILISIIPLLCLEKHFGFMEHQIIYWIFSFISCFIGWGILNYISFKIVRGTVFIYKDPHKAKTLNNIDFGESLPDDPRARNMYYCYKSDIYGKELPEEKNYLLRKFYQLTFWTVLIILIILFIPIFHDSSIYKTSFYKKINYISMWFLIIIGMLMSIYIFCKTNACFWCFYVKLFQLLGIFRFLEKDFNKTINSHNYFPISKFYYEKLKAKTPKPKSNPKD